METGWLDRELLAVWGLRVLYAAAIFFVGRMVVRLVTRLVVKLLSRRVSDEALIGFVQKVVQSLLLTVVLIAALDQLGVDTTSLVAVVGATGLAVGLALQSSLQNVAAGILLIVQRPFKAGDYVEAGGTGGIVEKVGLFSSVLVTPDNREVMLPNAAITGGSIINYSARPVRRIDLIIGISYGDDLRRAKQVAEQVLKDDERVLAEPAPVIAVGELADSSVNLVVRPWVACGDYWPTRFALIENLKLAFDAQGITIPFPQRDLHLYREEASS